eukprot:COSAG04_NODE_10693_length_765_cov_1.908953_2_plen_82_part_01
MTNYTSDKERAVGRTWGGMREQQGAEVAPDGVEEQRQRSVGDALSAPARHGGGTVGEGHGRLRLRLGLRLWWVGIDAARLDL